ncbi:MAG: SdpI family protein, partial [Anaerolineae bacterium]|nr:SdpI family protein [Anaerolineae bacterium]
RFDPKRESYRKFQTSYERFQVAFVAFFLGLHIITLTQYDNPDSVVRLILLGMGLFFAAIGNDMGRYRQTFFMGIRTPWTLADERVWKQTHRIAARWFVLVGIAVALMALLLPIPVAGVLSFVLLMVLVVGVYAYSYLLFRRTNA